MEDVRGLIGEIILEQDNKKINHDWTLEEFLNSFTKDQLIKIPAMIYLYKKEFGRFMVIKEQQKSELIKTVIELLPEYIKTLYTYLNIWDINIINSHIDITNMNSNFKLKFLTIVKEHLLGRIHYNKKSKKIDIYIPKEIKELVKEISKDKNIAKENKKVNKLYELTRSLVATYGIIEFNRLLKFAKKNNIEISDEEIKQLIYGYNMIDEDFKTYSGDEDLLIVLSLVIPDEDEVFEYYYSMDEEFNDKLTNKTIKDIASGKYMDELVSFKNVKKWLHSNYSMTDKDIEKLKQDTFVAFIENMQYDAENACICFKSEIEFFLEIDEKDKEELMNLLIEVFEEYPKWIKRGNK